MKIIIYMKIFMFFIHHIAAFNNIVVKRDNRDLDFRCGTLRFQSLDIEEALKEALFVSKKKGPDSQSYPIKYSGPLFDKNHDYRLWPLQDNGLFHKNMMISGNIFIVFDPNIDGPSSLKSIISRLFDFSYIHCTKTSQSLPESSSKVKLIRDSLMGYNCGHKFFRDHHTLKWLEWIQSNLKNGWKYPAPFNGYLYSENLGYLISPISNAQRPAISKWMKGTYFVVVTSKGEFIEIIARMKAGDFIKCSRESREEEDKPSEIIRQSIKPLPGPSPRPGIYFMETGYLCGHEFFTKSYLQVSAKLASSSSSRKTVKKYPREFNGPPFNTDCLVWSIFPGKKLYPAGLPAKYFLVLDPKYQIKSVMVKNSDVIQVCEETTRRSEDIFPETDSFECEDIVFASDWLENVVDFACQKLHEHGKFMYPAVYEGPDFDIPGPYLTFPLNEKNILSIRPGNHRVVFNLNCVLAGVLDIERYGAFNSNFYKCKRHSDFSIPGENGRIYEIV